MSARLDKGGALLIDPTAPFVHIDEAGYLYIDPTHEDVHVDEAGYLYLYAEPYVYAGWLDADMRLRAGPALSGGLSAISALRIGTSAEAAISASLRVEESP